MSETQNPNGDLYTARYGLQILMNLIIITLQLGRWIFKTLFPCHCPRMAASFYSKVGMQKLYTYTVSASLDLALAALQPRLRAFSEDVRDEVHTSSQKWN